MDAAFQQLMSPYTAEDEPDGTVSACLESQDGMSAGCKCVFIMQSLLLIIYGKTIVVYAMTYVMYIFTVIESL